MGCPLGPNVEPAAKKTSSRYGLPTLFQRLLPSLGSPHWAHNRPMWDSSWAAHLDLTWSPRPKKVEATWAAYMGPTKKPIWVLAGAHMGVLAGSLPSGTVLSHMTTLI